jgi:hypothetical protein
MVIIFLIQEKCHGFVMIFFPSFFHPMFCFAIACPTQISNLSHISTPDHAKVETNKNSYIRNEYTALSNYISVGWKLV